MEEGVDSGHLPLGRHVFVSRANHIVHRQKCLDLSEHHHVQLLLSQGVCLVSLQEEMVSVKEMVAVACTAATPNKKVIQLLNRGRSLSSKR